MYEAYMELYLSICLSIYLHIYMYVCMYREEMVTVLRMYEALSH
jgi:hypothetical protein